jgi:hypothetical protein
MFSDFKHFHIMKLCINFDKNFLFESCSSFSVLSFGLFWVYFSQLILFLHFYNYFHWYVVDKSYLMSILFLRIYWWFRVHSYSEDVEIIYFKDKLFYSDLNQLTMKLTSRILNSSKNVLKYKVIFWYFL